MDQVTPLLRLLCTVVQKTAAVIQENKKLNGQVKRGLSRISLEMKMVAIEIESSNDKTRAVPAHGTKIVLLKELAMDIEDFIDLTWFPSGTSGGLILAAVGVDPRPEIVKSLDNFKDSIQRVRDWKPDDAVVGSSQQLGELGAATWSASAHRHRPDDDSLGFNESSRDELLRWLLPSAAEGQPQELKVISIVGCPGMGKTALARAVYQACLAREPCEYGFISWVVASECSKPRDLVRKVLEEGHCSPKSTSRMEQPSLREFLRDKRYLVVIDDVSYADSSTIKNEFPQNGNSSRIIVTSSIRSVAAECSRDRCFVYAMQGLGKTESGEILWEMVGKSNLSPVLNNATDDIIEKCGGSPLALISAASYLRKQGRVECVATGGLTVELCRRVSRELGDKILQGQEAEFVRINRALLQCYNQLPDHTHRNCLLYTSVFPKGRPISSKVLVRRLIAEGLVVGHTTLTEEEVVTGCLYQFTDRSIVEPLINNAEIAKFRVYSIILEFIICKAISENFVALVQKGDNEKTVYNRGSKGPILDIKVRRLSVQDGSEEAVKKVKREIELCYMRSLTVCQSDLLNILGIEVCKLLRVLDLGGCKGVNDIVIGVICKLQCLKYLSLRGTDVVRLPPDIRHLEKLQTLDIRDTCVKTLHIEVIKLPLLAHLFGRFELPSHGVTVERSERSKLQTLAGVCIREGEDKSFENIILHARNLRKVKIYQTSTTDLSNRFHRNKITKLSCDGSARAPTSSNSPLLQLGSKALSVSIDSSDLSTEFVSFLKAPSAIASIKLRGNLEKLPAAATLKHLIGLHKLILISTGLSVEDLSALENLHYLQYLKLEEGSSRRWDGGTFIVNKDGFPSLIRLCFEAPKLPKIRFRQGCMKALTILELLSPCFSSQTCDQDESWFGVHGILHLRNLREVILHHSTDNTKMQAWKEAALWHQDMPSVKRQPQPQPQ